jgi:MYXO-CTERM domain-containing protein
VESNLAPTALTLANGYGVLKVTFTPYTARPEAPTDVKALVGQSQIGVSFTKASGNESLGTQYGAYFDFGSGSAATIGCGSGVLESAAAAADGGTGTEVEPDLAANELSLRLVKTDGDTATLSNLDGLGIQIGDLTAVSAVTIDPAGNISAPSEPVCVERVKTGGFYALCQADSECKDGLSSCSLRQGIPPKGLFAGLTLTGLALGFALRRRRKA